MIKYNRDAGRYGPISAEQADAYEAAIKLLSNNELLDDVIDLAAGDDWEGELTHHGALVLQLMREELNSRLKAIGFLE